MRARHEQLGPLEEVVLLWVVLEDDAVTAAPRPVGKAFQDLFVVF